MGGNISGSTAKNTMFIPKKYMVHLISRYPAWVKIENIYKAEGGTLT
jgi:hypothetical protein